MTDEVSAAASAAPISTPATPPTAETPAVNDAKSATPAAATPSADDFDEGLVAEGSRDNFRKFREAQKAKYGELQKQRDEYQQKLNEETRRRMEFEAKHAESEAKQKATQGQPEDPGPEPDYKQYATIEEYRDALKTWQKKQAVFEYRGSLTRQEQEQAAAVKRQKMEAKGNAARAKYPDFNQVISPILPVANQIPSLIQFMDEFDNGTDVLYHLGKNPAVLEGLSKLQPFAAGQELLRIQAALSAPPPKAVTQAPEPMKPVNTGNDSSVKSALELIKKEDVSDYVARENRKLLRSKRGD